LIAGVCICETLEKLGVYPKLKWPNDLYFDHKFGGILVESKNDISVLGIGLNMSPIEISDTPTSSLFEVLGEKVNPQDLLKEFLKELNGYWFLYQRHGFAKIIDKWNALDFLAEKSLYIDSIQGKGLGISPTGAYRLMTSAGILEVTNGSFSIESI
jgi:BirA family biotin operon repressor/biotin-[acetyl-CoA-carboxylase] ligase